jgi:hypothetical protein
MGEVSARRALPLLVVLGCSQGAGPSGAAAMTAPALPSPLEAELAAIRRDPADAIGFGEKAYLPYELRHGERLASSRDVAVTEHLVAEARDAAKDRVYRLAVLQVLAYRDDPAVDAALADAVADPVIGGLACYLVGRIGFKGYPSRSRAAGPLLRALAPHLDDAGSFDDPWYRKRYRIADLALAAFVRIAGPERFRFSDPQDATFIGYTLLAPSDAERATLLPQVKSFAIPP